MELREYIEILRKNVRPMLLTVVLFLLAGGIFQVSRPVVLEASLTLNITRAGSQQTVDYKYDNFYRLQADERFADTVVRWLGSPRIVTDIYNDAKINTAGLSSRKLSKVFKSQRLSSQMIQVSYVASNSQTAEKLAESITSVLKKQTEELNVSQKEESWFLVLGSYPVVKESKLDTTLVMGVSLLLGLFFGMWVVFIRYYLKQ